MTVNPHSINKYSELIVITVKRMFAGCSGGVIVPLNPSSFERPLE
jgi:hypothetical protein